MAGLILKVLRDPLPGQEHELDFLKGELRQEARMLTAARRKLTV